MKQDIALDILKLGKNVFLTGSPGSGKTFVLNKFIKYLEKNKKSFALTASTGIAASYINGITLHSFAGLGVEIKIDDKFFEKMMSNYHIIRRLNNVKILIIDEISMVSPEVFVAVDKVLKTVKHSSEVFGGVQVVLSGDFFQLPPVTKEGKKEKYIWQTDLWGELGLSVCYLHEKFRQKDKDFVTLLEEIRYDKVSQKSINLLKKSTKKDIKNVEKITKLYTHNVGVDRINNLKLSQLKTEGRIFSAGTDGNELFVKNIFSSTLVNQVLKVKVGARVIFIRNNEEMGYINGTIGEVVDFNKSGYPVVITLDKKRIVAEPEEWTREDDLGNFLAGVRQIPLKLAWALTIHKSQGMTLDEAVIDLSQAFEVGQGYVALSRIKSLSGLYLRGLNKKALEVDKDVQVFDKILIKQSKKTQKNFKSKVF